MPVRFDSHVEFKVQRSNPKVALDPRAGSALRQGRQDDAQLLILKQLLTLPPDVYADRCPWSKRETLEHWISERVLKLTCTAEDMIPLARACGFEGSRGDGVHLWRDAERAVLRAELDAAFFHLYGIEREDAEYMLTTFTNTGLIPEDERPQQTQLWTGGSIGEMTLDAYDKLSPLASGG